MEAFAPVAPDVYLLRVPFTGCWTGVVLVRGEENVLVDSGACGEAVDGCILPALKALGLSADDLHWLALTHIHGDHVGGAARLKELAPRMRVAVFEDSLKRARDPLAYSKQIRARFAGHGAPAPACLPGVEPDLLLRDGDAVGPLTLLHTPGHDTDSCCYLDARSRTLLSGDSLQQNGTVSQGCSLLMDAEGYGRTLERLMGMELQTIVAGHPYLPLGEGATGEAAVRQYLAQCLRCHAHDEGFVGGMLAAGVSDPVAIAKALIREVGGTEPRHLFLPLFTVHEYIRKRSRPT